MTINGKRNFTHNGKKYYIADLPQADRDKSEGDKYYITIVEDDKLLPFAMPLADHVGGIDGLSRMIHDGLIEVTHLGFIRGRDIRNSIILCSEAENMTKQHIQLLIGRVGEGSELWINGDMKQCDGKVFCENNGLMAAVDRLKGHPRFGYVRLMKTERSETAAMADLLD